MSEKAALPTRKELQRGSKTQPKNFSAGDPKVVKFFCPECGQDFVCTKSKSRPKRKAFVSCCCMVFFGLWCGCCMIPFCMDCCYNTCQVCPNCDAHLGNIK